MKINDKKYNLPPGYSFFQTTLLSNSFLKNPIKFISKNMDKFSGTYTATLLPNRKMIFTQNPEFINYILKENHRNYHKSALAERAAKFFGNGLLFSNGDHWLRQRRLIQPAFHKDKIKGLYGIVIKSITELISKFPVGEQVDIYPYVHQASFNILIKSLFDIPLSPQLIEELSDIFSELQDFVFRDVNQPLQRLLYPLTGLQKINLKKTKRLREILIAIINQRKSSSENYADLLDMLLNSTYEDTGESMHPEQITDELLIFIFAGHETTANTLSWLLHLIASNDASREKLIDSFGDSTINDCQNNEYLGAIIKEGMRLYPAAWLTERVALDDDRFGKFSYPKNTIIIPFFFGLHRDKKLWEDESDFIPERFIGNSKENWSKNYFPFGAGPRMCIGNNFAMAEMSFFLYAFLKEFNIKPTGHIPEMRPMITLRPQKVILNITKRITD